MTCSFQEEERGLEHQSTMPEVPPPESLADLRELTAAVLEKIPEKVRRYFTHERPFDVRPASPLALLSAEKAEPKQCFWIKAVDALPDDPEVHRNLLAYISDYQLVATSTLPHGIRVESGRVFLASLDHAMWFHRPFRLDDWMLYTMESPNATGARGLARGEIFARDGRLIATTAQEGLIRVGDAAAG
jgi:acyl-CoA thioesterase-2